MRINSEVSYVKKFAANVRKRRYELGITQLDLAEKVGCHLNHIGRLERGHTDATLSMMYRIARALHIDLKELIP